MAIPATSTHLPSRPGRGPLPVSAAAFSLGEALVYLAVLPALLQASLVYGIGFAVAGIAQVVLAAALLLTARRDAGWSPTSSPRRSRNSGT